MLGALLLITALAWTWLLHLSAQMHAAPTWPDMASGMDMSAMPGMAAMSPTLEPWTPAHGLFLFAMWAVMMVGMMTPSVAPMVLLYQRVAQQANAAGHNFAPAGWFLGGYLVAWALFAAAGHAGAVGTGIRRPADSHDGQRQQQVRRRGAAGRRHLPMAAAEGCLPVALPRAAVVRAAAWRIPGRARAVRCDWDLLHGLYCIGCCWALMALLFVGGVMNLLWIAALMILVLLEKILPGARWFTRIAGVAFARCAAGSSG